MKKHDITIYITLRNFLDLKKMELDFFLTNLRIKFQYKLSHTKNVGLL